MALITTEGGPDTNSYVTVAEADAYIAASAWSARLEWAALATDQKEYRLKLAALMMNIIGYRGLPACLEQRLSFPRWWRTDEGFPDYEDWDYEVDEEDYPYPTMAEVISSGYKVPTVPQEVKDAQCEVAIQTVHSGILKSKVGAMPKKDIGSLSVGGSLSMSLKDVVGYSLFNPAVISTRTIIQILLDKWVKQIGGGVG